MKLLIVGGTFNVDGGKPSHFVNTIVNHCDQIKSSNGLTSVQHINGGSAWELMAALQDRSFAECDALLWMPNVPNDAPKVLPKIKQLRPDLILIQSKRVTDGEYSEFDVVKRLLSSHSALGLMINKTSSETNSDINYYNFTVLDPLCNSWAKNEQLLPAIDALVARAASIHSMTREGSHQVEGSPSIELEPEFLDTVRQLGEEFTEYVTAINPDRFLGNASTRCCHGFPSSRSDHNTVYMSKRNVDKTIISNEQFVEVMLDETGIGYFGENKPSVDTPIQLRLYELYPNVNYMVHGHVYVEDAPYTESSVPCGFLEEVGEVQRAQPDLDATDFVINLKGHGCLIMASNIDFLLKHQFVTRPFLEPA